MELFQANAQWSSRPADERFASLADMYNKTKEYASTAATATVPYSTIRVEAIDGEVQLIGRQNTPARLTHWSFGQLAGRAGAPASYLRGLPATLAAQNLNHGLKARADESGDNAKVLFHRNGALMARAITSEQYSRIWNWEVIERLMQLQNWIPARPTTHWGSDAGECIMCSGTGIGGDRTSCKYCKGTGKELPALYASDHDMFAFLHSDVRIAEADSDAGLYRGVIVINSEVGARALKFLKFLFRDICGNFIIWGASRVQEISVRHVGDARWRFESSYEAELKSYLNSSATEEEGKIRQAKATVIAASKAEVLDRLFGMRQVSLPKSTLEAGYELAEQHADTDGNPRSVWGMVQGLTRHSQTIKFADERLEVDRAAGKLLEIAF